MTQAPRNVRTNLCVTAATSTVASENISCVRAAATRAPAGNTAATASATWSGHFRRPPTLGTGSLHHEHRARPIGHGPVAELAQVVRSPAVGSAHWRDTTGVELAGAHCAESQSARDKNWG